MRRSRSWHGWLACGSLLATACGGNTGTSATASDASAADGMTVGDAAGKGDAGGPNAAGTGGDGGDAGDGGAGQCSSYNTYKQAFFGDLHTHTSYSADAFGFATRNEPADAWGFARGKPLQV